MRTLFHFYKNRPEWMNECYSELRIIWEEKKSVIIVITSLIAVLFFSIVSFHKNTNVNDQVSLQNKRSEAILRELNDINLVLHDVESNPFNSKQQQMTLQSLEKNIASAQKSMINVAKSSDIQKVSDQITSVKDDIDTQMGDLKKTISEGMGGKQYLDANTLPFHVISVDVIAGQPYVSVEYASHVSPLSVGDILTGWRVTSADYESGVAEFINEKNQSVKIILQGG
jgi:hypothetical protein